MGGCVCKLEGNNN